MPHDIKVVPHRMESVTISSEAVVNSLTFSYHDRNGKQRILGPWGGPAGSSFTVSESSLCLFFSFQSATGFIQLQDIVLGPHCFLHYFFNVKKVRSLVEIIHSLADSAWSL